MKLFYSYSLLPPGLSPFTIRSMAGAKGGEKLLQLCYFSYLFEMKSNVILILSLQIL